MSARIAAKHAYIDLLNRLEVRRRDKRRARSMHNPWGAKTVNRRPWATSIMTNRPWDKDLVPLDLQRVSTMPLTEPGQDMVDQVSMADFSMELDLSDVDKGSWTPRLPEMILVLGWKGRIL